MFIDVDCRHPEAVLTPMPDGLSQQQVGCAGWYLVFLQPRGCAGWEGPAATDALSLPHLASSTHLPWASKGRVNPAVGL